MFFNHTYKVLETLQDFGYSSFRHEYTNFYLVIARAAPVAIFCDFRTKIASHDTHRARNDVLQTDNPKQTTENL